MRLWSIQTKEVMTKIVMVYYPRRLFRRSLIYRKNMINDYYYSSGTRNLFTYTVELLNIVDPEVSCHLHTLHK